jgi:hypothetical protein
MRTGRGRPVSSDRASLGVRPTITPVSAAAATILETDDRDRAFQQVQAQLRALAKRARERRIDPRIVLAAVA